MTTIPIDVPLPDSLKQFLAQPHCGDFALPKPGKIELCLPLGGRIQGMVDATKSIPDDCSLIFSLLIQLGPIMASIECLIKVLKLIKPLIDVVGSLGPPPDPVKLPKAIGDFAIAAKDVAGCILQVQLGVPMFVRDLMLLIAKFLHCVAGQIKSVAGLLGGLQLSISTAQQNGNGELLAQLQCAQENANTQAAAAMSSLDAIAAILSLAEPFFGLAGIDPIKLPAIGPAGGVDALNTTADTLDQVSQTLITVASALPGCM